MQLKKLLKKVLNNQKNIKFSELELLIIAFGFEESRISGSHHIYINKKVSEIINIQNVNGNAKPYQIKQFISLIEKYNLELEDRE